MIVRKIFDTLRRYIIAFVLHESSISSGMKSHCTKFLTEMMTSSTTTTSATTDAVEVSWTLKYIVLAKQTVYIEERRNRRK